MDKPKTKPDLQAVKVAIDRLEVLGLPPLLIEDLRYWLAKEREKQGGRTLTDLDLIELNNIADKLDATFSEVYVMQFEELLQELEKETGVPIPQIKNKAREYRKNR